MKLLDILSTSPQYFCRKWVGATIQEHPTNIVENHLNIALLNIF